MYFTIPNILSIFRIVASIFLLIVAYFGYERVFYILLGLMFLSDALDGFIARLLKQTSTLGAKLDSYGDIMTYLTTPIAIWFLFPNIIIEERWYITIAIVIYILPAIFSFIKFKQLASYHTWITKLSALLMSMGIMLLIIFKSATIFHFGVFFLFIEAFENILITLYLKEPKSDVRSIWHVLDD